MAVRRLGGSEFECIGPEELSRSRSSVLWVDLIGVQVVSLAATVTAMWCQQPCRKNIDPGGN